MKKVANEVEPSVLKKPAMSDTLTTGDYMPPPQGDTHEDEKDCL